MQSFFSEEQLILRQLQDCVFKMFEKLLQPERVVDDWNRELDLFDEIVGTNMSNSFKIKNIQH